MEKVKLEDLKCSSTWGNDYPNYGACGKIPNPGNKIFSCNICPDLTNAVNGNKYRCETCFTTKNTGHNHGTKRQSFHSTL